MAGGKVAPRAAKHVFNFRAEWQYFVRGCGKGGFFFTGAAEHEFKFGQVTSGGTQIQDVHGQSEDRAFLSSELVTYIEISSDPSRKVNCGRNVRRSWSCVDFGKFWAGKNIQKTLQKFRTVLCSWDK